MIVTIPFIFLLALAASQVTARYVDNGGTNAAAAKAAAAAAAAASQSAIDAPINAAATAGIQTYYSCASASLSPTPTSSGAAPAATVTGQDFFQFDRSVYAVYNGLSSSIKGIAAEENGSDKAGYAYINYGYGNNNVPSRSFAVGVAGVVGNLAKAGNVLFRTSHFGSDACQNTMQPRAPTCTSANCFCPPNTAYIDPNVTKGIQFICNSVDAAPTAGGDPSNHQGFNTTTGYFTCFDGYTVIDSDDEDLENHSAPDSDQEPSANVCACISPKKIDGNYQCYEPLDPYLLSVTSTITANAASTVTPAAPTITSFSTSTISSSTAVATSTVVVPAAATPCIPSSIVEFDYLCCPFSVSAAPAKPLSPDNHLKYHKKPRHGNHYYKRGAAFVATSTTTIFTTSFYTSSVTAATPPAITTESVVFTTIPVPFTATTTSTAPASQATDCSGTYYLDQRSDTCSKSANQAYLSQISGHVTARCGKFSKKY